MTEIVVSENEVSLNGSRFPIRGRVSPSLISTLPAKIVIGSYSLADEIIASSWVIDDQRGGILIEEMDEAIHQNRCWYSTCDLRQKGHIFLPPLVTEFSANAWTGTSPTGTNDPNAGWTNDANAIDNNTATTAYTASVAAGAWSKTLEFTFASASIVGVRTYCVPGAGGTQIDIDYYDGSWHDIYSGVFISGKWLTSCMASATACTKVRIAIYNGDSIAHTFDFNELQILTATTARSGTPRVFANFNSNLYMAQDTKLYRLIPDQNYAVLLNTFAANITALVPSVGNELYIWLGDDNNYYKMTAGEVFTQKNKAGTFSIHWDNKLFGMDSAGQIFYSADPNVAVPTWANNGNLADEGIADNDAQKLFIYRDADGDPVIYCATKQGLFILDFTNSKWLQTELTLPNHANCGKGATAWRDASFISAGLNVHKYIAGATATIQSIGLDRDDSLGYYHNTEIVNFIPGYDELFAFLDASDTSISPAGAPTIMGYDGLGWKCRWEGTVGTAAFHTGIVSTVYAYRLWFDWNDKVYWLPLDRGSQNRLKAGTATFQSSAYHITPWFDAAWAGNKLALSLKLFCKGTTAAETIQAYYRIDHTNTHDDITTGGWTSLGTIAAAGNGAETTYSFGTEGLEFKAIQFAFALVNGTSTLTPDLQYVKFQFLKLLNAKWGWRTTIDCSREYKGLTSAQLIDNLKTIVESGNLVEFTFRNESGGTETSYVKIANAQGLEETGEKIRGSYSIMLVAPGEEGGVSGVKTLSAANDTVEGGYYAPTTLHAVDADLVTGSIKSGVTIFGVAGSTDVRDSTDADAAITDVKDTKTFYAGGGAKKTGTLATVAITNANDDYPAGYHAGNVDGLDAIDTDLASANIKSGATIFGKAGAATVQDIADADLTVAEAPTGKKFYAVTGGVKTGTGTKTLDPANDTVNAGYYVATTLSVVDADLAVGNIKSGVTIFGFLGTYLSPISQDLVASAVATGVTGTSAGTLYRYMPDVAAGAELDLATTTNTFASNSLCVGAGFAYCACNDSNQIKLRLYMGGVQVAESSFLAVAFTTYPIALVATKALSGSKIVKISAHNYGVATKQFHLPGGYNNTDIGGASVAVGNVKETA